jgi:hypothetical protein
MLFDQVARDRLPTDLALSAKRSGRRGWLRHHCLSGGGGEGYEAATCVILRISLGHGLYLWFGLGSPEVLITLRRAVAFGCK